MTEFPPGPQLGRLGNRKVFVTTSGYDDIGAVLRSMNVEFEPFAGSFDCAILFVNCGTADKIDRAELVEFVRDGGCVYASDHADSVISDSLPGLFAFDGHRGTTGPVVADVVDQELREILGERLTISFDMGAWATLRDCAGEVILRESGAGPADGRPIMAFAEFGRGAVFFTSFHNRSQASDEEKLLLQLLVLKQMSVSCGMTLRQVGQSVGLISG